MALTSALWVIAVSLTLVASYSSRRYKTVLETCVNSVISTHPASDLFQCGLLCEVNRPSCSGFCFSKADNSCKLHAIVDLGPGTQEFGFRTYKLFTNLLVLYDSYFHCLGIGANLALPKDLQQSEYLMQLSGGENVILSADSAGHNGIFLTSGAVAEGGDQPLTYTNFVSGHPDNAAGTKYCIENTPLGWIDNTCLHGLKRVCQAPKPEVCTPLPSPTFPGLRCYKRIK